MADRGEQRTLSIIDSRRAEITAFGRDIYSNAELGFKEFRTSEKFQKLLNQLGINTVKIQ